MSKRKDLTPEQKIEILELYKSGISRGFLIKKYGIKNAICRLISESGFERTLQEAKKQKHHIELSKKTSLERYGVEFHTSKNSPIREKIDEGAFIKYGVKNVFQSEEIKNKIKQTNIERYGVEHNSQSELFKEKSKNTCLEKYGVEFSSQSQIVKDKIKQTCLERYGIWCN